MYDSIGLVTLTARLNNDVFKKMGQERPLFLYFRSFQKHLTEKLQASAGFELRLPEYMHADHYTTTLAHYIMTFKQSRKGFKSVRSPPELGKELFSRQR